AVRTHCLLSSNKMRIFEIISDNYMQKPSRKLLGANELLSQPQIIKEINQQSWIFLQQFADLYRNQIVVDEATDFSPVQLACMAALTHPEIRSFFACGDFNQRLTIWGSRSPDEIKWVYPHIEIKKMTVSYRQTRQLNELARDVFQAVGGMPDTVTLPKHVDCEGVAPVLIEKSLENDWPAWLAQRIREIERLVNQLPSIAIFVEDESQVQPVADALSSELENDNINVVACLMGQSIAQDNDVRIFDIQHIKGLEFEAVFFIGLDRLAKIQPDLFDKYLYVGITRAATYLGITCDDMLPSAIDSIRPHFVSNWSSHKTISGIS
ncbi:MAG: DNA helicase UvrD, partial [Proteobacteria bacterium]|nr:DNA helicase UvrD [Pseudomonadota bacterium]